MQKSCREIARLGDHVTANAMLKQRGVNISPELLRNFVNGHRYVSRHAETIHEVYLKIAADRQEAQNRADEARKRLAAAEMKAI